MLDPYGNGSSSSTTWEWRKVKIRRPAEGSTARAQRGHYWWRGRARRDPAEKLTITIWWRGGGEDWWMVRARGMDQPVPGHMSVSDLFHRINQSQ